MPHFWKIIFSLITLVFLIFVFSIQTLNANLINGVSISPSLTEYFSEAVQSDSLISVVVFANGDTGREKARKASIRPASTLRQRHQEVIEILKSDNIPILGQLKSDIKNIYADANFTEYWIAPALLVNIPVSKLSDLLELDNITAIINNAQVELIEPVEGYSGVGKVSGIASHLNSLNIPAMWTRGLTGKGRLVCSFDTGVEGGHPALQDKWRGNTAGESAAWFAPSSSQTTPFDRAGHGTHTMGLMVGSVVADSFGVAPDAQWISAAVIDQGQTLNKTFADILAAFQWAIDPDGDPATVDDMPDVILNSWGVPTTIIDACDETFSQAIDNVEAAGIVTIFAAGNEGPSPQSLRLPANRSTTPYNTLAVGAIDGATNIVAGFSSRGPSSCDPTQIKPEVVAPGVALYSSTLGGGYTTKSGTSMAAPLIAGLVALLRQYNPEATVDQIKYAIMQSARDLGPVGEDNDYGLGLPDAEAALEFLPPPPKPELIIAEQIIGGDGLAELGETFDFFIRFEKISGEAETLEAYLESDIEGVDIINDYALFFFGRSGQFSTNNAPFVIRFENSLENGQEIAFRLRVYQPNDSIPDTLTFDIIAGVAFTGEKITHATSKLRMTVTDAGTFGLGMNSIYSAGGEGLSYNNSGNLLFEAGIMVGRNSLQLSSSVRDSLVKAYNSDFSPVQPLSVTYSDYDDSFRSYTRLVDTPSEIPIPITIGQSVVNYDNYGDENFMILEYTLINNSIENITGLYFGFLSDFDLDSAGERLTISDEKGMLVQSGGSHFVGVLPLGDFNGIISADNGDNKIGLNRADKFNLINSVGNRINDSVVSDFLTVVSFGPYNIAPGDSVDVALALIVVDDGSQLNISAERAFNRYYNTTSVEDNSNLMPADFALHQNFPNPFNPSTVISFDIGRTTSVKLSIHNILGREVAVIFDRVTGPGAYRVVWDGTDNSGAAVGSGIYFYRMQTEFENYTRKMLLIK